MPPYVPSDENWPSVTLPLDGVLPAAAVWNVGGEAELDGLTYLRSRLLTWQPINATAGQYGQKVALATSVLNQDARFTLGSYGIWTQTDTTDQGLVLFELLPPHAMAKLAYASVRCKGDALHGGLPAGLPTLVVGTVIDTVFASIIAIPDDSPDVGTYDAWHTFGGAAVIAGMPFECGERLVIGMAGEFDAVFGRVGWKFCDLTVTWTSEDTP